MSKTRQARVKPKHVLLIVDGNNLINRGYYGVGPHLQTKTGIKTSGIKGFISILKSDIEKVKATHVLVVFDKNGCHYRLGLYPEYKGQRDDNAETKAHRVEIRKQIILLKKLLRAVGFCVKAKEGVEADDIMGSVADQYGKEPEVRVVISSNDKDLAQILDGNPSVRLLQARSDTLMGSKHVIEKYGVPPSMIVDYLAIQGDKVDNIHGVFKCGEVTAAKMINKYGSLPAMLKLHKQKKLQEAAGFLKNFTACAKALPLNRTLVTIRRDVARVPFDKMAIPAQIEDEVQYKQMIKRLELRETNREIQSIIRLGALRSD